MNCPISSPTIGAVGTNLSPRLSPQACAVSLLKAKLKTPQELVDSVFTVIFPAKTGLWHGRMGHPGTTMFRKMLHNSSGFVVVVVYVDDLNLVGTSTTCQHAVDLLTTCFEMKLLDKTSFCLGFQISHIPAGGIFLHQTSYTQKLLKRFGMDKSNPLSTSMMGRSRTFDDPYCPCEEEEEEFHDKTRYLAAVGALLYLSTFMHRRLVQKFGMRFLHELVTK